MLAAIIACFIKIITSTPVTQKPSRLDHKYYILRTLAMTRWIVSTNLLASCCRELEAAAAC